MNSSKKIVVDNIKKMCAKMDMTQKEFARRVGVTESAVSKWFSGEAPNYESLDKIAVALNVSPAELFVDNSTSFHEDEMKSLESLKLLISNQADARWIADQMRFYSNEELFALKDIMLILNKLRNSYLK